MSFRGVRATERRALAILVACVAPFVAGTHLLAESGSFGDPALVAHHGYLAAFVLGSLVVALRAARDEVARSGAGAARRLIAALPCAGRGPGFAFTAGAIVFALVAMTRLGEGVRMGADDLGLGVALAALLATISGCVIAACRRRLVALTVALVTGWSPRRSARSVLAVDASPPSVPRIRRATARAGHASRPPPSPLRTATA